MRNDYLLSPNKIEIKREILSRYHLKTDCLYNIPIVTVQKLVPNFFDKGKCVFHCETLQLYLRLGLKLKKIHRVLKFNKSPFLEFNTQKRIKAEKMDTEF